MIIGKLMNICLRPNSALDRGIMKGTRTYLKDALASCQAIAVDVMKYLVTE